MRLCASAPWGLLVTVLLPGGGGAVHILRDESDKPPLSLPLVWLHIPKTGSSFLNALVHTPSLCPGVPLDFAIDSEHCPPEAVMGCPYRNHIDLAKSCNGSFKWDRKLGEHRALGRDFKKGQAMAFFRQPEKRMQSHFRYLTETQKRVQDVEKFKKRYQGCQVKMMVRAGSEMGLHCGGGKPSDDELHEALRRVNDLVFVGLTERWDLSVCLFRKMFGGRCVGSDFINTRPTPTSNARLFKANLSDEGEHHELDGYVDHYDGRLYARAMRKFDRLLEAHKVSESSCQPCFDEKERAYVPADFNTPAGKTT